MTNQELFEPQIQVPDVVPYLLRGKGAKEIFGRASEMLSPNQIWFDEERGIYGSTPFSAAAIETALQEQYGKGWRVINLRDASRPEVMAVVKGRFYADTPSFTVQSDEDSYKPNQTLLSTIVGLAKEHLGENPQFPFMVTGFIPKRDPNGSYGQTIEPRDDFAVLHDERLGGEYSGKRFTEVDENGIPIFGKEGRTYSARKEGLSRLSLGRSLGLDASYGHVPDSGVFGRVVPVCGEAAREILNKSYKELNSEGERQIAEIQERTERAKRYIETGEFE